MPKDIIREMKFEDVPLCTNWWRASDGPSYFGMTNEEVINTDIRYYHRVFGECHKTNSSFVSVNSKGRLTGMAIGLPVPNVFLPSRVDLCLLAVHSENNLVTARLFKAWHEKAQTLNYERILVDNFWSTNFNYEKLGYKKLRETYYMEI